MRTIYASCVALLSTFHAHHGQAQDQDPSQDAPSINISVPLITDDLTNRVNGIQVACTLSTSADEIVATGGTYIFPVGYTEWDQEFLYNQVITYQRAGILTGSLESDEPVDVMVFQTEGYQIEGWVHGRCDLLIMHIDPQAQNSSSNAPIECGVSPPNASLHLCAFPDSDFVSSVEFVRPGFNRDGTLETLPGVD
ncbi:MAG: hypothetical protein AB8B88_07550 [Devosiaceae bacterium]